MKPVMQTKRPPELPGAAWYCGLAGLNPGQSRPCQRHTAHYCLVAIISAPALIAGHSLHEGEISKRIGRNKAHSALPNNSFPGLERSALQTFVMVDTVGDEYEAGSRMMTSALVCVAMPLCGAVAVPGAGAEDPRLKVLLFLVSKFSD